MQCFKVRRMLLAHYRDYLGRSVLISVLGTFRFHVAYLQSAVNRLG